MQSKEETEEAKLIRLASVWVGHAGRQRESDGTIPGWKNWSKRHFQRNEEIQVCQGRKEWRKQILQRQQHSISTLSLVSWNILSDTWLNEPRPKYDFTPLELKSDWSKRLGLLIEWVEDLEPDVLCFQEVDLARFDNDDTAKGPCLLPELSKFGYQGVIQKSKKKGKTFEQPCFVATFWKDDLFEMTEEKSFSRAQCVILKYRSSAGSLCLANVHLESQHSSQGSAKRARQLNSVLSYAKREAQGLPFALAGDFNTASDSAIFKVLRGDAEWHGHSLSSVYEHPCTRHTLPTCYGSYIVPGRRYLVDHILYSNNSLRMKCVLDPLSPQDIQEHILENGISSGFPTMFCPSDHIPVGVILEIEPIDQSSETSPLAELTEARKEELRDQWEELKAQKPTFSKGKPPPEEIEKRRLYASAVKAWKASIPKNNLQEVHFIKQLTINKVN